MLNADLRKTGVALLVFTLISGNISAFEIQTNEFSHAAVIATVLNDNEKITVTKQTTLNVVLSENTKALNEVVVVAYGVRKKGTISGSVGVIKADTLENVPVASFDQALQGKATGLEVLSNSGEPSAPASFKIRGVNSINAGTTPLFILDGIAISANDFSAINPNDIDNISVLKDASSTSIYGARAANGVIVITTKRGKIGDKGKIGFRAQYGISNLAYGNWTQMNTTERLNYSVW